MRYFIRIHQRSLYADVYIADSVDEGQVEKVDFKVVWKKNTYDVSFPLDERVNKLKEHINTLCGERLMIITFSLIMLIKSGIPPAMMKLMYKG